MRVFVLEGTMNGPMFLAYVKQCLVPTLKRGGGDRSSGCDVIYLPKYSPDLNPIKLTFSKLKAHLRKAAELTILRLLRRIGRVVTDFSPQAAAVVPGSWTYRLLIPKPAGMADQ